MRLSIDASGFEVTQQTRAFVQARVLPALRRFDRSIRSVRVGLEPGSDRSRSGRAACRLRVALQSSDDIEARATARTMPEAIDRALADLGTKLERELSRTRRRARPAPPAAGSRRQSSESARRRLGARRPVSPVESGLDDDPGVFPARERWKPPGADIEEEDVRDTRPGVRRRAKKRRRRTPPRPTERIR